MGVLDSLLEGFAAEEQHPPEWQGRFRESDRVRVTMPGGKSIVGRVLRPDDAKPKHAVIAPEGGGAHVSAPVANISLDTPAQHHAAARQAAADAMPGTPPGAPAAGDKSANGKDAKQGDRDVAVKKGDRAGIRLLVEGFAPAPAPPVTYAQASAQAPGQIAAAHAQLLAWSAQKHPRGRGGKFAYSTGGRRASRSVSARQRTLGVGAQGALVKSIQKQLGVPQTGVYNPQTRQAVTRYQQQHGLQVDGVVGRQTLAALRGHSNPKAVKPGPIASRTATVKVHASKRAAKAKAPTAKFLKAHPWATPPGKPHQRVSGGTVI